MTRDEMLDRLHRAPQVWDAVVIGGGATGLGCALDAAARGWRTALFETGDFAHATSSRSTKLFHGGVRYLRGGHMGLVAQSLRERAILRHNAGELVRELEFVVPAYRPGERFYYGAGLALYDWLARRGGATTRATLRLSRDETLRRLPTLASASLRGAATYSDDQFDDARFALALARTAVAHWAVLLNYARVESFLVRDGRLAGVAVRDLETGESIEVAARVVINATGVHADTVRRMDDPGARPMLRASRGAHIVLERAFLPGDSALLIPRTDDGRVVFVIPWRGRVLVGTTDTPHEDVDAGEPRATRADIDFLIEHARRYLARAPGHADVRSAFAGLRPLLGGGGTTASLVREHRIEVSKRGLVTIAGGKWTTYRLMAEETITRASRESGIPVGAPRTRVLPIDATTTGGGVIEARALASPLLPGDAALGEEAAGFARAEMARRVEDVLARRTRALFLDARAAIAMAPAVAQALARELGRDQAWAEREAADFAALAKSYLPGD